MCRVSTGDAPVHMAGWHLRALDGWLRRQRSGRLWMTKLTPVRTDAMRCAIRRPKMPSTSGFLAGVLR
jgi:hypothetical protein